MKQIGSKLGPVLVVGIFVGAMWLLHQELRHFHYRDVRHSFTTMPAWRLWAAAGLTVVNYLVLIGYDYLAIRAVGHPLPLGKIAFASFTGFAASYNFGALLGGSSIRYRLYSLWGFSAIEIVQLMIMLAITFWVGSFALAGVVLLLVPIPGLESLDLPMTDSRLLGMALLLFTGAYVAFAAWGKTPIRFRQAEIRTPGGLTTLSQLLVAAVDFMVLAACLYVLVSGDMDVSYLQFLGIMLIAMVVTVLSHVPGGVGVLELTIIKASGTTATPAILAALLAFRVIYYLLPLLVAMVMLIGNEILLHRKRVARWTSEIGRWAHVIAPPLLAAVTFFGGTLLLLSGALPLAAPAAEPIEGTFSLTVLEASHFLASVVGAGLLILAAGLAQRLDSAWWLSVALLSVGVLLSLTRSHGFAEALLLGIMLVGLVTCREAFYRHGSLVHQSFTPGWIAAVFLAAACTLWLGLFAQKHVEYSSDLWWHFAFRADAPRFLRGSAGAAAVLLLCALRRLVRPQNEPMPGVPTASDLEKVALLVQQAPQTVANLALLGDKQFLFNENGNGFVMYAVRGRSWIALGEPVASPADRAELVWEFRELADRYNGWPVFYQVGQENLTIFLDQGLSLLKLGEEARVALDGFGLEDGAHKELRDTYDQCQSEGVSFEVRTVEQVPGLLPQLRQISDAWLHAKGTAGKGFSLGYFEEDYLRRFPCAIVRKNGEPIAFANVWCGAQREELSVDLTRYLPWSPAGVMEYLFTELILWGKDRGYRWFNLGMAPLSGIEDRPLAPLWNRATGLVFRHGEHFYNFEGLRRYKEKFQPVWHPKYLASPGGWALPRIIADVTWLIGGNS